MEIRCCASVFVVDFYNKKTLLMYNKKLEKWLQPGGHINEEDQGSPLNCAKREAFEETGYVVDIIGIEINGVVQPFAAGWYSNKVGNMVDVQYIGIPIEYSKPNSEGNKVGFFSIPEMIEMGIDIEIIKKVEYILDNCSHYVKHLVNH